MLRLYMDVHVKAAITAGLRKRSIDVLTAQEDGADQFDDIQLLECATELNRILFSQDDDLLAITKSKQDSGVFFAGLVYGHQLAATIGKFVIDLELLCNVFSDEDMANRIEYLPFD